MTMKTLNWILLAASLYLVSCGPTYVVQETPPAEPAPVATVTYQSFYDDLAPYGTWINYPGYGYVWTPNAGPDFVPYNTNGYWVYSDAGWTWASNYSWGWAPFHYGRWFFENGYGWMWVPGNEWAPAWVSWRTGGDYYGWAPLGPNVSVSVAMGSYNPPAYYWNFVPRQYVGNPSWHSYYVDRSRNVTIISNTTIINNYSGTDRARYAYAPGPDVNEVRRVSGSNIQQVRVREVGTPASRVNGNQLEVYRPRVDAAPANRSDASARPAPARSQNFRDMRPQAQYQQPQANNPGPAPAAGQRPADPRPIRQEPANNNTRPATQQPVTNPQVNQPAPANNNERPVYQRQENNPGRAYQPPANTAPVNRPASIPAATQPAPSANNNRPAPNSNPANTGRPVDSRYNQRNAQPVQQQSLPQPSPANRRQMQTPPPAQNNNRTQNTRPAQQATHPVQQSARPAPQTHPAPVQRNNRSEQHKPEEKPATRQAN